MNKKLIMINLILKMNGLERAKYLKKHKIFYKQGECCYFHPYKIPSEPYLISMHNNVVVAANVTFVTHDILSLMFSNSPSLKEEGEYKVYMGTIELLDNVFNRTFG